MTIEVCDLCKGQFEDDAYRHRVGFSYREGGEHHDDGGYEICGTCYDAIKEYADGLSRELASLPIKRKKAAKKK